MAAHVLGIPAVSTVTHPGPGTMPHPPQLRLDLKATKGERTGIYITNKIGDLTNRMNHQNILDLSINRWNLTIKIGDSSVNIWDLAMSNDELNSGDLSVKTDLKKNP